MVHSAAQSVRPEAVAGAFYPAGEAALRHDVDALLAAARPAPLRPKALVVPHAGYVYSGPVAASAYALVRRLSPKPSRVVLLGPSHHVGLRGLALPKETAFHTPLGLVPVDTAAAARLAALPCVRVAPAAHEREHSLEVQLPFLQRALDDFTLLPLAVGRATPAEVASVLELEWGGDETLVVVSSDLSHYLPYDEARRRDEDTARRVLALDTALEGEEACGAAPLCGLLEVARRRHLRPTLLDLRSSGDTAGGKGQVVGYGAFAFSEEA